MFIYLYMNLYIQMQMNMNINIDMNMNINMNMQSTYFIPSNLDIDQINRFECFRNIKKRWAH